uniref:DnaJ homolog subfamily C member 3-like n=1 Tax=Petromyzon marinus TaxID=7757 RepID=A0AAJ7XIZ0_PETMA|nr:dnaJ homolog subfamily C member 3-like [Petromyzon marinus]
MIAPVSWVNKAASSFPLLLVLFDLQYDGACGANTEVDKHLEMGKKLLAAGQLADALSHYHAAVEGDPGSYLTYYKRATVYLAMGRSKAALPDLSRVIELKPDFTAAQLQRGNVFLKQGKLEEAQQDFLAVLASHPGDEEAAAQMSRALELQRMWEEARSLHEWGDHQGAVSFLDKIVDSCPWDSDVRELRADCHERLGSLGKAIQDLKPTTKLRNDNTAAHLRISRLHYSLGEQDDSLAEIRECLKLDPDHQECFAHYRKVKKLCRQLEAAESLIAESRYEEAVAKLEAVKSTEASVAVYGVRADERICHCLSKSEERTVDAVRVCSLVLDRDPDNVNALRDRAEAHIASEQYEEAVADYERARGVDENAPGVREGLEKAQKLLKQSQRRDYYKILGVKRSAKKQEIVKAYRKLAQQWHPDNFQSESEKKKAEKHFIDIAAAKEVLTDPEKRSKFDAGEDPLDPESQQGGGGNPWQRGGGGGGGWHPFPGGFNPFGSGGPQFKFHFN